jgi:hypothetical protein
MDIHLDKPVVQEMVEKTDIVSQNVNLDVQSSIDDVKAFMQKNEKLLLIGAVVAGILILIR